MRHSTFFAVSAASIVCAVGAATAHAAAADEAFTYQGELTLNSAVINDLCDFRFRLWDDEIGGNQIGIEVEHNDVIVLDGRFSVDLDFGVGAFRGGHRWLEIDVRHPAGAGQWLPLDPRQRIMASPYAIFAQHAHVPFLYHANGVSGYFAGSANVGIGINSPIYKLDVRTNTNSRALFADNTSPAGATFGVYARAQSPSGRGVFGLAGSESGHNFGVYGQSASPDGHGVFGWHAAQTGNKAGVHGVSDSRSETATGVRGVAQSTEAGPTSAGVHGENFSGRSQAGAGVRGTHYGFGTGVYGESNQTGVHGIGGVYGVRGQIGGTGAGWAGYFEGRTYVGGNLGVGTAGPEVRLQIMGFPDATLFEGGALVLGSTSGTNLVLDDNEIMARNDYNTSPLYLNRNGGNVHVGGGPGGGGSRLITPILEIIGGSDLSEQFDVAEDEALEPGMVVVIDPDNPGALMIADRAHDRRVAGVVSGAGGVRSGMVMGQRDSIADGAHPVALTGRVYVWCDASYGGIEPGDFLTTSDTLGHAMKVGDHDAARGAILGKAMTRLEEGRGLVLILVNLQ